MLIALRLETIVERELDPTYLGRIAARTAEQAIKQRLRQFEKEHIYDEFRDQVGGLVTGIVRRKERGDLVVEVGKAEALLPWRERVPGEDWVPGERIRCLLHKLEQHGRGPELILSRSSLNFVRKLLKWKLLRSLTEPLRLQQWLGNLVIVQKYASRALIQKWIRLVLVLGLEVLVSKA